MRFGADTFDSYGSMLRGIPIGNIKDVKNCIRAVGLGYRTNTVSPSQKSCIYAATAVVRAAYAG